MRKNPGKGLHLVSRIRSSQKSGGSLEKQPSDGENLKGLKKGGKE